MNKLSMMAAIAVMSCTSYLPASEGSAELLPNAKAKRHSHSSSSSSHGHGCHHHRTCKVPLGSYYVDSTSQDPLQQVFAEGEPVTVPVHFSGTNVNAGVALGTNGSDLIIPKRGYYKIEWNASIYLVDSQSANYTFDLQKNGTTLLHPISQVFGQIHTQPSGTTYTSAAASVIVPLLPNDEIALIWTVDGPEGFTILEIESAQISAQFISDICN